MWMTQGLFYEGWKPVEQDNWQQLWFDYKSNLNSSLLIMVDKVLMSSCIGGAMKTALFVGDIEVFPGGYVGFGWLGDGELFSLTVVTDKSESSRNAWWGWL